MTVVGVIVRAATGRLDEVRAHFDSLADVQTFSLEEPSCVGLVFIADGLKSAHRRLREQIQKTAGVLTAWPVQVHDQAHYESENAEGVSQGNTPRD